MSILVCGSMAYDTIMVFQDQFRKHILADQIHILNVSFLVPTLRREFGGCAGNIAYSLRLLGSDPLIMATVGHDFGPYAERLSKMGISSKHIRRLEDQYTAQAFITTDIEDNQITAFHPGAMGSSHLNRVAEATEAKLGIVSPDGREGMLTHTRGFAEAGIPYLFDPGQGLPMFSGEDLLGMLKRAKGLTVNDYEARIVEQKTGRSIAELAATVEAVVVTRGGEGSTVYTRDGKVDIAPVKPVALVDPTGCGDAYRAGLLHGLAAGWDWVRSAKLASVLGSLKIAHRGGQNHKFTREQIGAQLQASFGESL